MHFCHHIHPYYLLLLYFCAFLPCLHCLYYLWRPYPSNMPCVSHIPSPTFPNILLFYYYDAFKTNVYYTPPFALRYNEGGHLAKRKRGKKEKEKNGGLQKKEEKRGNPYSQTLPWETPCVTYLKPSTGHGGTGNQDHGAFPPAPACYAVFSNILTPFLPHHLPHLPALLHGVYQLLSGLLPFSPTKTKTHAHCLHSRHENFCLCFIW